MPRRSDLDLVLDLAAEGCLLLRRRGPLRPPPEIVYANRRLTLLTGHAIERLVGRSLRVLRPARRPPDRFPELLEASALGRPFEGPMPLRTAADGDRPFEVRLHPLGGPGDPQALFVAPAPDQAVADGGVAQLVGAARSLAGLVGEALYVSRVEDDLRLTLVWADARFAELTGYTPDALAASGGYQALVPADDLPLLRRRNQALLGGEGGVARYRLRTRAGRIRRVRDTARAIAPGGDTLVGAVLGTLADDGRASAERSEAAQERLAALLGRQLQRLVCLVDDRGLVSWASPEPPTPLADAVRGLVQADPELLLPPRLADDWLDLVDRAFAGAEAATGRLDWPLGRNDATVEVTMVPVDEDRALALIGPVDAPAAGSAGGAPPAAGPAVPLAAVAALGSPLIVLAADGRILEAGEAAAARLGLPGQALAGRALVEEAAGPAHRAPLEAALAAALALPGSPVEVELALDGRRWPVTALLARLCAVPPTPGGQPMVLALLLEPPPAAPPRVSALPDAVLLEAILESLPDAVLTVDASGIVDWMSASAERMFGRRGQTLVGRSIEPLFEGADADGRRLLDGLVGEWPAGGGVRELRARRASGELFPVEVTGRSFGEERRRFALVVRDLTLRLHTEATLANLAYHDALTGLPNRLLFHDRLAQAVERGRRTRQMFAVILVDLDRFKLINDSLGMEKGDHVLKAVADRLSLTVRKGDTVARLGGDEFMLLLAGTESAEAVATVAQKLLDALRPPLAVDGHELTTTASIGVALFPHDGDTPETLVKNADTALSRAKEQGRNHFQLYTTDMNAMAFERLMLESRLRRALEHGELVVYYQPQASLETGAIVGVEALIRWIDPVLGLVPPGDFIPLAEETGLIVPIGAWVLRTACAEIVRWQRRLGRPDLRVAVNLSARQFQQADLLDLIQTTLADTGLPAGTLELEITESVVMRDATISVRRLKELTGLGVHLAIDDFGTGYSSLAYLRTFPIRSLKIDRTFIRDIDRDPESATLAQGVVGLGRSLGLRLIAEGVETPRQLEMLKGYGCQEMQGFLLSRPVPAEEALAILKEGRTLADVAG